MRNFPIIKSFLFLNMLLCVTTAWSQDKNVSSSINEGTAKAMVEDYYVSLQKYIGGIQSLDGSAQTRRNSIEGLFRSNVSKTTTVEDYRFAQKDFLEDSLRYHLSVQQYLDNLGGSDRAINELVKKGLKYKLKSTYGYRVINDSLSTIKAIVKINNVRCTASFTFLGNSIYLINVTREKPKERFVHDFNMQIGAGMLHSSKEYPWGLPISIDIGGLSNNWFVSRLRFGLEYCFFMDNPLAETIHYREWKDITAPATLTYIRKDGNYGVLASLGYTFIPNKLNGPLSEFTLSASMGAGVELYDFWTEMTGVADYERHFESSLILHPSIAVSFRGVGLDLGYYYFPQNMDYNGMNYSLFYVINF